MPRCKKCANEECVFVGAETREGICDIFKPIPKPKTGPGNLSNEAPGSATDLAEWKSQFEKLLDAIDSFRHGSKLSVINSMAQIENAIIFYHENK